MPEIPITFDNVEVLSASDLGLMCRIQGKVVPIGRLQMLGGADVRDAGDRGRLVLPRCAVDALGLEVPPLS